MKSKTNPKTNLYKVIFKNYINLNISTEIIVASAISNSEYLIKLAAAKMRPDFILIEIKPTQYFTTQPLRMGEEIEIIIAGSKFKKYTICITSKLHAPQIMQQVMSCKEEFFAEIQPL